jgi:hypothetical protein
MHGRLWKLVFVVGVVMAFRTLGRTLIQRAKRRMEQGVADFENPRFTTMTFAELPPWVSAKLAHLRSELIGLGFRELVSYTRASERLNYTCVLVADDGEVVAHVWVARSKGLLFLLTAATLGRAALVRELRVAPRYGLITSFSDARRVETSPVEILARSHVAGQQEYATVPETMPLAEALAKHRALARDFAAKQGAAPVRVTTEQQFFDTERALMIRLAEKLRRQLQGMS